MSGFLSPTATSSGRRLKRLDKTASLVGLKYVFISDCRWSRISGIESPLHSCWDKITVKNRSHIWSLHKVLIRNPGTLPWLRPCNHATSYRHERPKNCTHLRWLHVRINGHKKDKALPGKMNTTTPGVLNAFWKCHWDNHQNSYITLYPLLIFSVSI